MVATIGRNNWEIKIYMSMLTLKLNITRHEVKANLATKLA